MQKNTIDHHGSGLPPSPHTKPSTSIIRSASLISRLSQPIPPLPGPSSPSLFLQLTSWLCSLGGLLFGYGTSIISDSLHFMTLDLQLTTLGQGVITSSLLIGAALGAFVGGQIADQIGRRRALILLSCLNVVGNLCSSLAPSFHMLLPARVLLGFTIGGFSSLVPVLLAELSPTHLRAQMAMRNSLLCTIGQLLAFVVGAVLGSVWEERQDIWRWMNALALLPAGVLVLGSVLFVPESPRWLVSSGHPDQAYLLMRRLRSDSVGARAELEEIERIQAEGMRRGRIGLGAVMTERWLRNCTLIGLGMAFSQQSVGVAAPMFFGTYILERSGMAMELAMDANVSIGVVAVVAMAFGLWISRRTRRRPMLLVGLAGSALTHLFVVLSSWLMPDGTAKGTVVLVLLIAFTGFLMCAITSVTWFMMAEIFPLHMRGILMGLCSVVIWLTKFAHGLLLPPALALLGIPTTFAIFLFFTLIALAFVWLFLPETWGKTLEELEEQFREENWEELKRAGKEEEEDEEEGGRNEMRRKGRGRRKTEDDDQGKY